MVDHAAAFEVKGWVVDLTMASAEGRREDSRMREGAKRVSSTSLSLLFLILYANQIQGPYILRNHTLFFQFLSLYWNFLLKLDRATSSLCTDFELI